ncbi:MAG: gliding motility-associated C-terminal domain-containing protein [Salibacteraceae bacterium]
MKTILTNIKLNAHWFTVIFILVVSTGMAQDQLAFRIKASASGMKDFYSNTVEVNRPLNLFVPNAFSPNNDGVNDVFKAKGEGVDDFQMVVYDRFGKPMFKSNDIEHGWDGFVAGTKAPIGVYTYEIIAEGFELGTYRKTGTVMIASNE